MYPLLFIEGVLSFVSPCILPLLPIYLAYLAGDGLSGTKQTVINTLGFIAGFSTIFIALGATSTALGRALQSHRGSLTQVGGIFIILLGLYYLGQNNVKILEARQKISESLKTFLGNAWRRPRQQNNLAAADADGTAAPSVASAQLAAGTAASETKTGASFRQTVSRKAANGELHFFSSFVFGFAFCAGWTPCLFTWLASALALSANSSTAWQGGFMLAVFSLGLGLPFLLFAIFLQKLKAALQFIRRNLNKIQVIAGILLVIIGFSMWLGVFNTYLGWFNP
ncbi:cytochrome c biogenesis CcdA family protein [Mageeibacillus indolicus]|jgi:hypothetical protein|uniref:Cytochrome C biogenesis protein CcdA n=1 Tax=Mageeibacillus indolicus TaxID=884684 RepID=A0A2J8B000_9FIRM|nr:cytochrome c biogenesis CcdA family protein [Mageeibacillus indolicus]PNH18088.1 cytochrome C biogenesis protein CcdA [Mageeibacillus indolicus]